MVANIFHDFPENLFKFYFLSLKEVNTILDRSAACDFCSPCLTSSPEGEQPGEQIHSHQGQYDSWRLSLRDVHLQGASCSGGSFWKKRPRHSVTTQTPFTLICFACTYDQRGALDSPTLLDPSRFQLAFLLYFQSVGGEKVTLVGKYDSPLAHVSMIGN